MNEYSIMTETRWAFIHPFQLRVQRGIEVYLWNLALALTEQGVTLDILTWAGPLDIPDYARIPRVKLHRVPSVRYFQAQFAVLYYVYWLLKGNYQHVFVHFAGYGEGLALRLARLVRPILFSIVFHFPPSLVPHRYREFAYWGFQHDAIHLIAVSQATAGEVEKWAGRRCEVIGHGVDTECFHPDATLRAQVRKELGIGQDVPILITVAGLEERKGMQWVIRAMPKVLERMPDTYYLILGDGSHRGELEKLAHDLNLNNHVLFLGFQKNVAPYLGASDVALLMSKGEAFGVSILEYCAAGLPVITSPYSPFPDYVQSDWGQMVPEQDAGQLSQAILELLLDTELRTHRGTHARTWVSENHVWSQVAQQYIDLVKMKQ
jgi:glycosyltransferase involved in cell wall biosynthesis